MHLFEDLVITEVVDADNRPVPPDEYGAHRPDLARRWHQWGTRRHSRRRRRKASQSSDRPRRPPKRCPGRGRPASARRPLDLITHPHAVSAGDTQIGIEMHVGVRGIDPVGTPIIWQRTRDARSGASMH
jgi:hypothetical protein